VLDYKADTVDEKSLADKVERYRPQLEAYRRAVARLLGVETDKIKTQVVFVRPGWVIDLPYPSRLTEPCS
jgi:ATP-dependent exoDNAse (exonuclease V) beta subunit